jgi:hypothetical protein
MVREIRQAAACVESARRRHQIRRPVPKSDLLPAGSCFSIFGQPPAGQPDETDCFWFEPTHEKFNPGEASGELVSRYLAGLGRGAFNNVSHAQGVMLKRVQRISIPVHETCRQRSWPEAVSGAVEGDAGVSRSGTRIESADKHGHAS